MHKAPHSKAEPMNAVYLLGHVIGRAEKAADEG
jgi:hypothetical protein